MFTETLFVGSLPIVEYTLLCLDVCLMPTQRLGQYYAEGPGVSSDMEDEGEAIPAHEVARRLGGWNDDIVSESDHSTTLLSSLFR